MSFTIFLKFYIFKTFELEWYKELVFSGAMLPMGLLFDFCYLCFNNILNISSMYKTIRKWGFLPNLMLRICSYCRQCLLFYIVYFWYNVIFICSRMDHLETNKDRNAATTYSNSHVRRLLASPNRSPEAMDWDTSVPENSKNR